MKARKRQKRRAVGKCHVNVIYLRDEEERQFDRLSDAKNVMESITFIGQSTVLHGESYGLQKLTVFDIGENRCESCTSSSSILRPETNMRNALRNI